MTLEFKDKRITVMGLGLLGRGLAVSKYLAGKGAKLTITDIKTKAELMSSVEEMDRFTKENNLGSIKFVLGEHRVEDFTDTDMVIRAPNAPIDSIYLAGARKAGVPVEMDASLFAKLSSTMFGTGALAGVTIVGVTGTRGKTTTTHLICDILKSARLRTSSSVASRIFVGGNVRDGATLPLLDDVHPGDYVVLELDSWQLQGFGEAKLSPEIAVFTSFMPDHLNYYKGDLVRYFDDKRNIFKYQKAGDHLVVNEDLLGKYDFDTVGEIHKTSGRKLPAEVRTKLLGAHNLDNIACAVKVGEILKIPMPAILHAVENFLPVPGRLQPLGEKRGILFVNDNNSTTPDATIAALRALGDNPTSPRLRGARKIVLIFGGDDKKLDMSKLVEEIPKYCSKVVMFKERGTDTVRDKVFAFASDGLQVFEEDGLRATFDRAVSVVEKGDIILFSPAFSSFGKYFKNEYDRGDQFVELFKNLK